MNQGKKLHLYSWNKYGKSGVFWVYVKWTYVEWMANNIYIMFTWIRNGWVGGQCKKHESAHIYHHQKVKILQKRMSERTDNYLNRRWLIIYGSLRDR